MVVNKEEKEVLTMAAIRKLKNRQLSDWEKDFIGNIEDRLQKTGLTENQKTWLNRLKKKYLQK